MSSPEEDEHFGGAGNVLQTLKRAVKSILERQQLYLLEFEFEIRDTMNFLNVRQ